MHAPSEDKSGYPKDSLYEELEQVFYHFPEYRMKIILGDFNAKVGKRIFSKCLLVFKVYIRIVMIMLLENFPTSEYLVVNSTMFPHRNIHKCTWASPGGKTHKQIHHISIYTRWESKVLI